MLNYFQDLPPKQKVGFICLVLAAIGFIIFLIAGMGGNNKQDPTPTPTNSGGTNVTAPASSDNPTVSPTIAPTSSASPVASAEPTVVFGETHLSVDEIRSIQDTADTALTSFLTWPAEETATARAAKLTPFFVANSELVNLAPDMKETRTYIDDTGKNQAVSVATIDYISDIGGNDQTYRINIGAVLSMQYNYSSDSNEKSGVIKTSGSYDIDFTKINGEWKIKAISVN